MDNPIQVFQSPEFGQVRTTMNENVEPLFCAVDVCKALGYGNSREALRKHVEVDDVTKRDTIDSMGRKQSTSFINESGLYSLILGSKLPQAREFKHWVTSVVLPQIRKTGGYIPLAGSVNGESDAEILSRALLIAQKTIDMKNKQLEVQRPQVQFAEAIATSDDSILIRDLAKLITQNGYPIGQNRLFNWLRAHGYLFKKENRPCQEWVEKGYFSISESLITTNHHGTVIRVTTKVSGLGQQYFVNGFLSGKFNIAA